MEITRILGNKIWLNRKKITNNKSLITKILNFKKYFKIQNSYLFFNYFVPPVGIEPTSYP